MSMVAACHSSARDAQPGSDSGGHLVLATGGDAATNARDSLGLAITRVAYLSAQDGPRTLVEGRSQPNEYVTLQLEFLDAALASVSVDDGAGGSIASVVLATIADDGGVFFVTNQSSDGFEATVRALRVTATTAEGGATEPQTASFGAPPLRADGMTCDARGFDACVIGDVCAPAGSGRDACFRDAIVRAASCANAPRLDPARGVMTVNGRTSSPTLWDAPVGCVQSSALGQPNPESVVLLHIDALAPVLTLTTTDPATDMDTVLFVLPACGDRATTPLACNDDGVESNASTLVLTDVAAGDYVVVVESATAAAGAFRLTARLR